ncbi:right-handed parallel beta-helix repeat-containing protein [Methylohalobius crimeensis]|uniref:hypothetical protein n=1 Tax=Methylohalobius crimeensis TaxID=244365 RepID=UPI000417E083|nr:hypothetical protein [Methylohalobius crimeensis]
MIPQRNPKIRRSPACLLAAVMLFCVSGGGWPARYAATPRNYVAAITKLAPGDTLKLAPGEYRRGLRLQNMHGTRGKPIVIEGRSRVGVVFFAQPRQDMVVLRDSSFVTLRNLELDGRGELVNAVRASGRFAHHITLENLHIHGLGRNQQMVGISTKCPTWDWIIRGNVIDGAGTGMYLGNSDGSDPFIGGLIEGNLVMHTMGYNLQIKHQNRRPEIPGIPQNRRSTTIRYNVFSKGPDSSTGPAARPNVLVGHLPLEGPGRHDRYLIYGNFFYQNPTEALFQGEGNIALYNNLFFNTHAPQFPAVAIQPHNDIPRKVRIFFNTVLNPWKGIRILYKEDQKNKDQKVIANAVFSETPLQGGQQSRNITASFNAAKDHLVYPNGPLGQLDFYPIRGKLRSEPIDWRELADYPRSRCDFNGTHRDGTYRGAYAGAGVNPGWRPALERRPGPVCGNR